MAQSRLRSIADAASTSITRQEHAVDGENKQQDRRPKEQRKPDNQGGNRNEGEGGSKDRNRNRRPGGGGSRKGVYRFDDQMEHAVCQCVTHKTPKAFPVNGRFGLATMPPVEVARTEASILLCDMLHEGPHLWPNGDEAL
jgi:hypothetical protein